MNRQTLYIIILSVFLLIAVILFSTFLLIPKGKEYRSLRLDSKKEFQQFELTKQEHAHTEERLKELQERNAHTIKAFTTTFNPDKFEKLYKKEFTDLYLTEVTTFETNGSFTVYEVNATSKITSPESFYNFIESVNKSKWIIEINFPIHFERDGDKIRSSFTMRVHNASLDKAKKEDHESTKQHEPIKHEAKKELAPSAHH